MLPAQLKVYLLTCVTVSTGSFVVKTIHLSCTAIDASRHFKNAVWLNSAAHAYAHS